MSAPPTAITELRWRDFSIPGSSPAVLLARLHVEPAGGFTVVVRFPPGWTGRGRGTTTLWRRSCSSTAASR